MSREKLRDWIELAGIIAIVASLVFVGLQLRQDRAIAQSESSGVAVANSADFAELLRGRGDLWIRGLDNDELTAAEQIEFFSVASAVENHLIDLHLARLSLNVGDPNAYIRDYAFAVYIHPGLRKYFEQNIRRIALTDRAFKLDPMMGGFLVGVIEGLEELENSAVPIPTEKPYLYW